MTDTGARYYIDPVAKPRQSRSDKWKKRPCVLSYRAFADKCRTLKIRLPQPCKVVFYMPMPPGWSNREQEAHWDKPHQRKPDLDNLLKALFDAVLKDDSKIWSVHAEKRWAYQGAIEITEITG